MSGLKTFDQSVVTSWNHFLTVHGGFGHIVAFIALYAVYLIPLIWLVWWFITGRRQREVLLSAITAGIVAWVGFNHLIKGLYFHNRPITSLPVKELLFARPENSFPSDHAAFLSAIAFFFLFQRQTKTGAWLFVLALVASMARIAVAVHYPSDILGGFLSGLIAAWIVNYFHEKLTVWLWEPVIALAKKLHLA